MTNLNDYKDLGDWEPDYECNQCGHATNEKFRDGECPACSPGRKWVVGAFAKERLPVDHSRGVTGYPERTVRL